MFCGSVTVSSSSSSPFKTARPSFLRFSKISHLAFRMFSRDPRYSMCISPTFVITAMSGFTISPR